MGRWKEPAELCNFSVAQGDHCLWHCPGEVVAALLLVGHSSDTPGAAWQEERPIDVQYPGSLLFGDRPHGHSSGYLLTSCYLGVANRLVCRCPSDLAICAPLLLSELWRSKWQSVLLSKKIPSLFQGGVGPPCFLSESPQVYKVHLVHLGLWK